MPGQLLGTGLREATWGHPICPVTWEGVSPNPSGWHTLLQSILGQQRSQDTLLVGNGAVWGCFAVLKLPGGIGQDSLGWEDTGGCRDSPAAEGKCDKYFQRQLRRKVLSRL